MRKLSSPPARHRFRRGALPLAAALAFAPLDLPLARVSAAPVVLNEYNGVAPDQTLKEDRFDPAFGPAPVKGNGGPWFELLVCGANATSNRLTDTTVDLRGWHLEWSCKVAKTAAEEDAAPTPLPDGGKPKRARVGGVLALSEDPFWQSLRAGTLLTFTKNDRAHGGADTDTRFEPALGRWHLNVWAGDLRYVASGGAEMDTNASDWQMTLKARDGSVVYGPAGEGVSRKHMVGKSEVGKLEEVEPRNLDARASRYGGDGLSTFGLPNQWDDNPVGQDLTLLRGWAQPGVVIAWQDWRDYWFTDAELLAGKGDPDADPDGDGLSNLIEAALGLNPRVNDAQRTPVGAVRAASKAEGGGYYLTLEVDKPATQVQGIGYRVETSADGAAWSDEGTVVLVNDPLTLQVRDNVKVRPKAAKPTRFIRLNVLTAE